VVRNGALDGLTDPPRRVRRELVPASPIELLDRPVEAERPLLDQIQERHAEPAVPLGDGHDEAQVRLDHAPFRRRVAALDRLRERDLLGRRQELVAPDVGEEELEAVRGARDDLRLRLGRGLFGRLLGLLRLVGVDDPDLEPDPLELARQVLEVVLVQLVLERERLELGRVEVAPLLRALDEVARAL
jgi:hypothetical protein